MTAPLVSAVIIVRDGERFVEEAVRSVLAQTYEPVELVVVDDGSTDSSVRIVGEVAAAEADRVRLVRHPGGVSRGMSASRNLGVHAGHGSLVGFLDADDVWLPEKLSEQVAILERHPRASMVYGRTLMWRGWRSGAEPGRDFFYDLGVEPDRLYDPPRLLPLLVRNRFQTPTTCNALVRREVYDDLGGFEEDFAALYEDQVFFAKLHLQHPTFVAGACWARYRQHAGNSERRFSYARYYRRRRPFLEWLATYLAAAAADDELAAIVADELRRARRPRRAAVAARMALASAR